MREIRCKEEGCELDQINKTLPKMDGDTIIGEGIGLIYTIEDKHVSLKVQDRNKKGKENPNLGRR
jgi:hypothetical protein